MKMNQELQTFTIKEFQSDFDNLISRVENGESFLIRDGKREVLIVPFRETIRFGIDSLNSTEDEEIIQIHRDHEEGS
jgi:antitoxin (DNA-binding transcriptional repressor) of toxin-antitoxin stability system